MTFHRWERSLLAAFDIDVTPERVRFLDAWARCEGGTARFNPLNTTLRVNGSTSYNQAGVQHYLDAPQGVAATVLTLRLAAYRPLVAALRAKSISAHEIARLSETALHTWGTGSSCIIKTLGPE